ncbi:mechanosensitive ion channel [Synechococcus sp. RSCCF101]|uniref:mechanosensitive ion channel family protein n=1 Tax=Synechococcus sp. RSCCF101 TaxID=2511069 RepID=UPI001246C8CE|nr:mechanosensitive ion channel family protein [Synechococcus sp. RSCCF101]QEY32772.1 mechanosensitive ion channel [Synechococcus sp. RSCCF101]
MGIAERLLVSISLGLLLGLLRRRQRLGHGRARQLPRPPLGRILLFMGVWVSASLPLPSQLTFLTSWRDIAGQLALLYACLTLGGWAMVEVPGSLGWQRRPAKILLDLSLLILGAVLTLVLLQERGVNLVGLVTTSAVLTAVIGFAAQEPLKDVFGGLTLQIDRPFKEGDWIELDGVRGKVVSLTLMNTWLLSSIDGSTLVLPNDTVAQGVIRRVEPGVPFGNVFHVGLDYSFPPTRALDLLRGVVAHHPGVLNRPAAKVWVDGFDDSSIRYGLQVWHLAISDIDRLTIRGELQEQIWYALERVGQSIPFPIREVLPRRTRIDPEDPLHADDGTRAAWLARNPLFVELSSDQLEDLAPATRCVRFARGDTVVEQGEDGDALFQIISGSVEVCKRDERGREQRVACLGIDNIFGEMALCTDEPRSASVRALEETVLLEVERRDLQPLIDRDASVVDNMARLMHRRRQQLQAMQDRQRQHDLQAENQLIRSMRRLFNVVTGST